MRKMKIAKVTSQTLLVVGIAILIASSCIMMLFLGTLGNSARTVYPLRVACVGDSITEGSGYPDKLQSLLGTDYTVGNFGVSGSTMSLRSNKPYMNQTAFQKAKAFLPTIVVIMLGTNDASPETYQYLDDSVDGYEELIGEFQALPSGPEIWLVKPPPIYNSGPGPNNTNLVQGVIPSIEHVADDMNLPTIDVYASLANHSEHFPDGIHPDSEGAKVIATEVYQAITFTDNANLGALDIVP